MSLSIVLKPASAAVVHHHALEAEASDAACEFASGRFGVRCGSTAEPEKRSGCLAIASTKRSFLPVAESRGDSGLTCRISRLPGPTRLGRHNLMSLAFARSHLGKPEATRYFVKAKELADP